MKGKIFRFSMIAPLLVGIFGSAPLVLHAQDDGVSGPPKVLVINREFTKPGRGGAMHEKTEAAYIAAMEANNGTPRYLAMTSMSGPDRALFFMGYSSLAAWETENKGVDKNVALTAALDRAMVADGDLVSQENDSVWLRRDDLSLEGSEPGLTGARYMEITDFAIKPGHRKDWDDLVKMVTEGYKKGVPGAHWTVFQQQYGAPSNEYLVITPLKTLGEVDREIGSDKGFADRMGEDGMKRVAELEAACIESEESNLFEFSPKMSYPPDAWVKAEPDYWHPKSAAPVKKVEASKKAKAKPAE